MERWFWEAQAWEADTLPAELLPLGAERVIAQGPGAEGKANDDKRILLTPRSWAALLIDSAGPIRDRDSEMLSRCAIRSSRMRIFPPLPAGAEICHGALPGRAQ